jgi:hypothetical protein
MFGQAVGGLFEQEAADCPALWREREKECGDRAEDGQLSRLEVVKATGPDPLSSTQLTPEARS